MLSLGNVTARSLRLLPALLLLAAGGAGAQPLGPSPYLCFDAAATGATGSCSFDSPLKAAGTAWFHLEDFEDDAFEPGWSIAGAQTRSVPGATTDSVDEDDGALDGSGTAGSSHAEAGAVTIDFDESVLGALPTHVGVVWTDGGTSATVALEAFGATGNPLGSIGSAGVGDASGTGETAEDRFFGWIESTGISAIRLSQSSEGGLEIDHLQYGGPEPEPPPSGPNHFLCYKAKPTQGGPGFEPLSVSLANPVESGPADVKKYAAFCVPADKNGEGIPDPDAHLASFKLAPEADHEPLPVALTDQFGDLVLETRKADRLLVPAARSQKGPVPPPLEPSVDHFQCYPVKTPTGEAKFVALQAQVADELAAARTLDVKKPTRLCTAVEKNGEPVLDPAALLLCYKARPAKQQPKHEKRLGLHVAHQFGSGQLDTVREDELCVPTSMPRPE